MKYSKTDLSVQYATRGDGYSEMTQVSKIRFSLGYAKTKKLHTRFYPIKCRDFFTDVILAQSIPNLGSIYRFDPYIQVDLNKDLLVIDGTTEELANVRYNMHVFEEIALLSGTKSFELQYGQGFIALKIDPIWWKSPLTISYLTLLIRFMGYNLVDNLDQLLSVGYVKEFNALAIIRDRLDKKITLSVITRDIFKLVEDYPLCGMDEQAILSHFSSGNKTITHSHKGLKEYMHYITINSFHDNSGIISLLLNYTCKKFYHTYVGIDWVLKAQELWG